MRPLRTGAAPMTRATLADIENASHIDRGYGLERITHHADRAVYVMPHFGIHPVRVPYAAISEWATLTDIRQED